MPDDDLISTAQAAKRLDVNPRTVLRLAADGSLPPALRMPGRTGALLFHRADVERLATQRVA